MLLKPQYLKKNKSGLLTMNFRVVAVIYLGRSINSNTKPIDSRRKFKDVQFKAKIAEFEEHTPCI